jgi:hypothetical protein
MSNINYKQIKSIVQKGVEAGLISAPVPMRRNYVVTETHKSPKKQRPNKLDICESRAKDLLVWYKQGWTQGEMAAELGMSKGPVAKFFRNRNMAFKIGAYVRKRHKCNFQD